MFPPNPRQDRGCIYTTYYDLLTRALHRDRVSDLSGGGGIGVFVSHFPREPRNWPPEHSCRPRHLLPRRIYQVEWVHT